MSRDSKSRRKIKNFKGTGLKIVDDSDDVLIFGVPKRNDRKRQTAFPDDPISEDEHDELPVYAGVTDERPLEVQQLEYFESQSKWKRIGETEIPGSLAGRDKDGDIDVARPVSSTASSDSARRLGKTLDGKRSGLQTAAALRDEMIEHRKRENRFFETLDEGTSGRHAKTILRDRKTGTRRDLVKEAKEKEIQDQIELERKEKYDKWGKGLKQISDLEDRTAAAIHEMSKPLARYEGDEDLERYLKNQEREGDPMLKFLSKGSGNSSKPRYGGPPPPPNRFHILPGARWDGVDRSNGYEKEWFSKINTRKALDEEAYKWSVEDL